MTADHSTLLASVLADPGRINALSVEEAALLLAQVAAIQANLAVRVASAGQRASASRRAEEDRLISVDDAAERLGVTARWLYRHAGGCRLRGGCRGRR